MEAAHCVTIPAGTPTYRKRRLPFGRIVAASSPDNVNDMEKLPLDRARWPFIALLASAAMLATAHAVEAFLHFAPCQMCYWQRYVFWGAGVVALISIALNWRGAQPRLMQAMCILLGLIFLGGAVIAIWHSLVEWKILPPLSGCVASGRIEATDDL